MLSSASIVIEFKWSTRQITPGTAQTSMNYDGSNAFFVRADLAGDLFPLPADPEDLYDPFRYVSFTNGRPSSEYLGTE